MERKKFNNFLAIGLVVVFVCSMTACSEKDEKLSSEEESTTKMVEVESSTIEEKTTIFDIYNSKNYKGRRLIAPDGERTKDALNGLIISPGIPFQVNSVCGENATSIERGSLVFYLYESLNMDASSVISQYGDGTETLAISYEENYEFISTADNSYIFEYVGKNESGDYFYDFHIVGE